MPVLLETIALLRLLLTAWRPNLSQDTAAYIEFALTLAEKGSVANEQLEELAAQIRAMVADQRSPTPSEWSSLTSRSDAAHARIQNYAPTAT